jgi:hypothetical protein
MKKNQTKKISKNQTTLNILRGFNYFKEYGRIKMKFVYMLVKSFNQKKRIYGNLRLKSRLIVLVHSIYLKKDLKQLPFS